MGRQGCKSCGDCELGPRNWVHAPPRTPPHPPAPSGSLEWCTHLVQAHTLVHGQKVLNVVACLTAGGRVLAQYLVQPFLPQSMHYTQLAECCCHLRAGQVATTQQVIGPACTTSGQRQQHARSSLPEPSHLNSAAALSGTKPLVVVGLAARKLASTSVPCSGLPSHSLPGWL